MDRSTVSKIDRDNSTCRVDETARRFVLWALAALKLHPECDDQGAYSVLLPEDQRASFGGVERIRFAFDVRSDRDAGDVQCAAPGSRFYAWMIDQLKRLGPAVDAAPKRQPSGVREIAPQLFEPYTIDGGAVHLRGCLFEDQPLLRLTYRVAAGDDSRRDRLVHVHAKTDGSAVEPELLEALHLDELVPPSGRPPRLAKAAVRSWLEAAQRLAVERFGDREGGPGGAVLDAAAIVWCKYAVGKLAIVIGQNSVESPFSGWAQFFADRRTKPPPFSCPASGKQSYHLAATDDGRITVAEAIAVCSESGARVLESDLERCEATGRRVLPEHLEACPVTGMRIARSELVVCPSCRQRVAPATIEKGGCAACRNVQAVPPNDARLTRVLDRFPGVAGWSRWRISETSAAYVLRASSLFRQLLLVVDKETMAPLQLASAARWPGGWTEIPESRYGEYLS